MSSAPIGAPDQSILLTPGDRLGWVFRDRNLFRRRFLEPGPAPPPPPNDLFRRLQAAKRALPRRLVYTGGIGLGATVLAACCDSAAGLAGPRLPGRGGRDRRSHRPCRVPAAQPRGRTARTAGIARAGGQRVDAA